MLGRVLFASVLCALPVVASAQPPSRLGSNPPTKQSPPQRNFLPERSEGSSVTPPVETRGSGQPKSELPPSRNSEKSPPVEPPVSPTLPPQILQSSATNRSASMESSKQVEEKLVNALIKLKVPENATVWIEQQQMKQAGPVRTFQSPTLEMGKTYYYKLKVTWPTRAGQKDFLSEQEIAIRGGETTTVDFTTLASQAKYVAPLTSTSDMIKQAAQKTPAPNRDK